MRRYGRWIGLIICLTLIYGSTYCEGFGKGDACICLFGMAFILKKIVDYAWDEVYGGQKDGK